MNGFIFVDTGLAFGAWWVNNHDAAISRLVGGLRMLEGSHSVYPKSDADIFIRGNANASVYDGNKERFFKTYEENGW